MPMANIEQVLIIINPYCHQGKGWKRWLHVKNEVLRSFNSPVKEYVQEKGADLALTLPGLLSPNNCIISAGGDGSMHYLVNTLLQSDTIDIGGVRVGAIGLGSSNDFLKPFNRKIKNIPVRINNKGPHVFHDVGIATYYNDTNLYRKRYFIVNASFGITAAANRNFNYPGRVLKFLKTYFTGGAILYTAVQTILSYKNYQSEVQFNDDSINMTVSNINVLKIPFVSGSFYYSQQILPDDGRLGLNICSDMNKLKLLETLYQLGKGKFITGNKRISEFTTSFQLISNDPVIFECDGETDTATNINISIRPRAIKILTR